MARFAVNASVLKQHGREMYCFVMNSARLRQICYVTPRSQDNPEEIQRILDEPRAHEIGEYIKKPTSLLPNAIVVSLTQDVRIEGTATDDMKIIHFPGEEGKFAYILDGQHRLAGFRHSEGLEFDLPVVAIYMADDTLRGKIFADINSKQVRVSDVHLLSLYYQIRDLPVDESSIMDVISRLNADIDSPLRGRIKMLDTDRGTWVKNAAMKKWLSPHLTSGGVLATKTVAEQAQIIKNYFGAVAQLWPDAWGDTGKFNLSRPIGLEILLSIFAPVKHRCDLNAGRQYSVENFLPQMSPLRGAVIELPGGGKLELDWQRGTMGFLSNRASRTMIARQLSDMLRRLDEENA